MTEEDLEATMLSKTDSNCNAVDLLLEAREFIHERLARSIDDTAALAAMDRLTSSLNDMAKGFKEALVTM